MKHNKIAQLMATAILAVPMAFTISSCTDEDLIDNYSTLLGDSTYFVYDIEPFDKYVVKDNKWQDTACIYTFEVSSPRLKDCKKIGMKASNGIWNFDLNANGFTNLKTDRYEKIDDEYRFYFGAGEFKSVVLPNTCNAIDIDSLHNVVRYPGKALLDSTYVNYILSDSPIYLSMDNTGVITWENANYPLDNWSDKNIYTNADGRKGAFVANCTKPMYGGYTDLMTIKVGEHKTVEFTPQIYTQDYELVVTLTKDDDALNTSFDDAYASIACIPNGVGFIDGRLDVDNVAKLSVKLYPDEPNNRGMRQVTFRRTFRSMGLCYGRDSLDYSSTYGPGVIQFFFKGLDENNARCNLMVLCNVKKSMQEAGIVECVDDKWYKTDKRQLPINFSTKITKSMMNNYNFYSNPRVMVWKD